MVPNNPIITGNPTASAIAKNAASNGRGDLGMASSLTATANQSG
jgi:hypothetical protein